MQLPLFSFKPMFIRERRSPGTPPAPAVKGRCPPCLGDCVQGRACPAEARERVRRDPGAKAR